MNSASGILDPHGAPLRDLFPAGCHAVLSDALMADFELLPGETAATDRMAPRRLQAFRHGRACARAALADLGYAAQAVPIGEHRAPVWPAGIVGSIAHSGPVAAAVVARRGVIESLGIDVEHSGVLEPGTLRIICTPRELKKLPDDGGVTARVLFSAKESIFKCLWPVLRRFIDFQEVEIVLGPARGSYQARPAGPDLPGDLLRRLDGRYRENGDLILTSAWLQAAG